MDPIKNPFSPGAGSPPPELAGRAPVLEQARILLGRVLLGKPEKSLMLTGPRGVGKTQHGDNLAAIFRASVFGRLNAWLCTVIASKSNPVHLIRKQFGAIHL